MIMFTAVLTCLVALLCSTSGLVDGRVVWRDVIDPPILYPTSGTVWNVGERHNVTWDTSVIPPGNNNTGMIVLGFEDPADGANEHLDLGHPLAKGFFLSDGRAEITVPTVATRDTYIIVLFGDSGNASPQFTIKNISITSPSSSTTVFVTPSVPGSSTMTVVSTDGSVPSPMVSDAASPLAVASSFQSSPASSLVATNIAPIPLASTSLSPGISSTPASPVAQSASPSKIPNAGTRLASFGTAAIWGLASCSITVALVLTL